MPNERLRLILASASPRRLDLLAQIGIVPDGVDPAEVGEAVEKGELPADVVRRLAETKARCVAERNPGALVLGADTVVACGRRIMPKAHDEEQAGRILGFLSGRRHRVYGGIVLIDAKGAAHRRLVVTAVSFKRLEALEIDAYLASGEWRDKAGAYAIQGRAGAFVQKINGSYSNVVGLSLFETVSLLKGQGFR
ncbi:MAG: septum formation protein Maf [Rhodospirillales bacterium RIFCSPLOWO2_12_FULL_58_28]|nr:MAG: septum formation protein Maf [Rhodospirillales bacterium RIFCSPLOWO2_02_FULL_58_16]OHC77500.1 MAG: septum formation protein Maf [Rhodospirillales bacterium RIFCSPLOWO2_12_FULL_58_28]